MDAADDAYDAMKTVDKLDDMGDAVRTASKTNVDELIPSSCRNPYGKKGGPAHQELIDKLESELNHKGFEVTREYRVPTPNGEKSARYLDLYAKKGDLNIGFQVGRSSRGLPVAREIKAMRDIMKEGYSVIYVPYI